MTETFWLWSPSWSSADRTLSFFATRLQLQCIHKGTREMISEMLKDVGAKKASPEMWSVSHFRTNYLAEEDSEDAEWEDIWQLTWELKVEVRTSLEIRLQELEASVGTWATDDTWVEDETANESMYSPSQCVVVADFYTDDSLALAQTIFKGIGKVRHAVAAHSRIADETSGSVKRLVEKIAAVYLAQQPDKGKASSQPLSLRRRNGHPNQLLLYLGVFDDKFYKDGAGLALSVIDLCHQLGATTTMEEKEQREDEEEEDDHEEEGM